MPPPDKDAYFPLLPPAGPLDRPPPDWFPEVLGHPPPLP